MCGIAGIVAPHSEVLTLNALRRMTDAIAHRGPDGEGFWINEAGTIGLGHRRLSILDLSASGAQPMELQDRYVTVYNGEIYNYLELKEELQRKGYRFTSHCDTEILLALYDDRRHECLQDLDGMFAFVIYDRQEQTVFFARDRFGEKPFYYARDSQNNLYFASEMKALWAVGISRQANFVMVYNFIASDLVENPEDPRETFYQSIFKLPAAHYCLFPLQRPEVVPVRYWDIAPEKRNSDITPQEAIEAFNRQFNISVSRRLRSDVAVGSSLSGGLDSSLVVCTLRSLLMGQPERQKTFSAQFPGYSRDESRYQKIVVDHCGVSPFFVFPSLASTLGNLDTVGYHQEEPFISASISAQHEVFGLAKDHHVTVLLDGQGADEILAGYGCYIAPFLRGLSPAERRKEEKASAQLHAGANGTASPLWRMILKSLTPRLLRTLYSQRRSLKVSGVPCLKSEFCRSYGRAYSTRHHQFADLQQALHYDTTTLGLERLLRYADRNSMAHSREVRLPFLYHSLVELLFSLPDQFKIHEGWSKWILRKASEDVVPQAIVWRKDKVGYEPPQAVWTRQPAFAKAVREARSPLVDAGLLKGDLAPNELSAAFQWKILSLQATLFRL